MTHRDGLLGALALITAHSGLSAQEPTATDLILKAQEMLKSDINIDVYSFEIIRLNWQRIMRIKSWDDRPDKRFFIHVLAPKKEKDATFLKVRGNLWMYLPKLERDIKIPPSMMLNSWMGSDFTNDDLVKPSSVVENYSHRLLARYGTGDAEVAVIESLPWPAGPNGREATRNSRRATISLSGTKLFRPAYTCSPSISTTARHLERRRHPSPRTGSRAATVTSWASRPATT